MPANQEPKSIFDQLDENLRKLKPGEWQKIQQETSEYELDPLATLEEMGIKLQNQPPTSQSPMNDSNTKS